MLFDFENRNYALVTSTTYGNWLPGEERGFVSKNEENIFGTPFRSAEPELKRYTQNNLRGVPVFLDGEKAETLLRQWHEEVEKQAWNLLVAAIMSNLSIYLSKRRKPLERATCFEHSKVG